jgi:hypothetical protein
MPLSYLQGAVDEFLTAYNTTFLGVGQSLYMSFALIIVVWAGIRIALSGHFHANELAKLVLVLAFGKALVNDFAGGEWSVTNLVLNQTTYMLRQLDQHAMDRIATAYLQADRMSQMNYGMLSALDLLPLVNYCAIFLAWGFLQTAAWLVIAFGDIAVAVCVVIGPVFVPFFIVPKLDWLFWGWLKAFMQFAFYKVVATAVLIIVANACARVAFPVTMPGSQLHTGQILPTVLFAVVGAAALLKVPTLTANIFSGSAGSDGGLLAIAQSATGAAVAGAVRG